MAKKPKQREEDDRVLVMAASGFKHEGEYIRTGETCRMRRAEAEDMAALYMVRILEKVA